MASAQRHGTEPKREFSNERTANRMVDWLNAPSDDPARNRIRGLLRDLHFLAESWEEVEDDGPAARIREDRLEQFNRVHRRVSLLFRRYKFYPMVWPWGPGFVQQWAPVSGPDGKFTGKWPPTDGYSDNQAIFELTWLMPRDVTKIRQCSCGRWLFARFSHQRFCSAKCREREFKSSPEWKEYRRQKAREYYRLHKSGKVK